MGATWGPAAAVAAETRDEALGFHRVLTEAFPDLHIDIEDLIAERDRVATRLSFSGTHLGDFRGIAPTERSVLFTATRIYRLADGKIAETWANQDALGLLQQLREENSSATTTHVQMTRVRRPRTPILSRDAFEGRGAPTDRLLAPTWSPAR